MLADIIALVGRHAIVEKLQNELQLDITSERQVVYLLAEVRKLLEVTDRREKYFALYFHCSWALHTRMKREGAARILERFDTAHGIAVKTPGIRPDELSPDVRRPIEATMLYDKFRDQFEALLDEEGLPKKPVADAYNWCTFMSLFTDVIEECPLELASQGISLKHVSGVTVNKIRSFPIETSQGDIVMFGARWTIHAMNKADQGEWGVYVVLDKQLLIPQISAIPATESR